MASLKIYHAGHNLQIYIYFFFNSCQSLFYLFPLDFCSILNENNNVDIFKSLLWLSTSVSPNRNNLCPFTPVTIGATFVVQQCIGCTTVQDVEQCIIQD